MATPAQVVRQFLIDQGVLHDSVSPAAGEWPSVAGPLPSEGINIDRYVAVQNAGADLSAREHHAGEYVEHPNVVFTIRSLRDNEGHDKGEEIASALRPVGTASGGSLYQPSVTAGGAAHKLLTAHLTTAVAKIGTEEAGRRQLHTLNARLSVLNPAFTPASLTGLRAWWESDPLPGVYSDTAGTVTVLNGQDAASLGDRAGNGLSLFAAVASLRPQYVAGAQNGRAVLRFNGTLDVMLRPNNALFQLPGDFTLFAVASGGGADETLVSKSASLTVTGLPEDEPTRCEYAWQAQRVWLRGAWHALSVFNDANPHFGVLTYAGTTLTAYRDGVSVGSVTAPGAYATTLTGSFYLGGLTSTYLWSGDVALAGVYGRALTSTEVKKLWRQYTRDKWGTP